MAEIAIFGNGGTVNPSRAYRQAFGDLPDGIVYYDPMRGIDLRPKIAEYFSPLYKKFNESQLRGDTLAKSLSLTDWTLPVYPLKEVANQAAKETPVVELMPRITTRTKTVDYDRLDALGSAKFFGEGGTPAVADDTYTPVSTSVKFMSIAKSVTGPMLVAGPEVRNPSQTSIENATLAMKYLEENAILNGDSTATASPWGDGTNAYAYDGLRNLVPAANDIDAAGASITTNLIRQAIRTSRTAVGQRPDLIITDFTTLDAIKELLQTHIRYVDPGEKVSAGIQAVDFDGIPIVASSYMPDTASARELLVVNTKFCGVHVLQDTTMEALGKTKDADEFFLKQYSVFICRAPKSIARVKNLA
ncbi:SU10 major capsid protein [Candidatus Pyrohabitans sp.]